MTERNGAILSEVKYHPLEMSEYIIQAEIILEVEYKENYINDLEAKLQDEEIERFSVNGMHRRVVGYKETEDKNILLTVNFYSEDIQTKTIPIDNTSW